MLAAVLMQGIFEPVTLTTILLHMTKTFRHLLLSVIACGLAAGVSKTKSQEPASRVTPDVASGAERRTSDGERGSPGDGDARQRGPGRPMMQKLKLVEKFDKDGDERLDAEERKAAREYLAKERAEGRLGRFPGGGPGRGPGGPAQGTGAPGADGERRQDPARPEPGRDGRPESATPFGGPGGGGPPFGSRRNQVPAQPGRKLRPADVTSYAAKPLYDPQTLRTLFFEFENADWEKELADFHNTDVEVPAELRVDRKTYKDVGIHFRGMSSFMMVGEGYKRSFAVSLDFTHEKHDLKGYKSLDLLNSHEDPSFMRAVLYYQIAREYLPAPKANFVRVVINGESWGIYVNKESFNKDFVQEWYGTKKGVRWKVPGSPMGRGGLEYLGEDVEAYKSRYELKSKDDAKAWRDLIKLSRVLNETPADQLVEKLSPILDIDGALRFLALDNALINNDGYWIRASDYSIYEDESGQFHIIPHDANETFSLPGGPGFPGGGRGGPGVGRFVQRRGPAGAGDSAPGAATPESKDDRPAESKDSVRPAPEPGPGPENGSGRPQIKGVDLDPLVSANDPTKPLLSKLLAVPALRERYLGYMRDIAEKWLDWEKLGPVAKAYAALIEEDVKADTRNLESTEAFDRSVEGSSERGQTERGPGREISLKTFAEQRRAYLLGYPAIKALGATASAPTPRRPCP